MKDVKNIHELRKKIREIILNTPETRGLVAVDNIDKVKKDTYTKLGAVQAHLMMPEDKFNAEKVLEDLKIAQSAIDNLKDSLESKKFV